jgi:hypothetical protein
VPKQSKTKTTFVLDAELYDEFSGVVKEIGLRRDLLLNKWLAVELDYLRQLKANSTIAEKFQKAVRLASKNEKKKVVLTLDKSLLEEINAVCREKGVLRDSFLEGYMTYLLKDDENDVGPPLYRILELVKDPRAWYGWTGGGARIMPYDELSIDLRFDSKSG